MKNNLNEYRLTVIDLSALRDFIISQGTTRIIKKKEYLIQQGDMCRHVGYISEGMFRYKRLDSNGDEHITGYSLEGNLVGEYSSCLCGRPSLSSIQAIKDSLVHLITYTELEQFWNSSPENQRIGRILAEQLFAMTYRRLTDSYCCTAEERYIDFMNRYPDLKELIPLKEIASFIGVTPETVSAIRKKLLKTDKS